MTWFDSLDFYIQFTLMMTMLSFTFFLEFIIVFMISDMLYDNSNDDVNLVWSVIYDCLRGALFIASMFLVIGYIIY